MDNDGEWTRSENLLTDMLRLFEEGMYYDCTFQLVSKETGVSKVVKCHKAVLCASSCVFTKILFGHFREAHQGADDPIPLPGVTLEVFEFIMRELYGQEKKFDSVEFAMDVYKFAHEMQMPSVMHAVNQFFKTISTSEALSVLDLCIQLDNKEGIQICKEVLQRMNCEEVLNSADWLEVTERVLQEVLQLQHLLDLSESEVVAAVLKWGRAQVEADGHDPSDTSELRHKIDSSLKFIRWPQFTNKQFSELCQGDLGLVLSGEEKSKIQECICLDNWEIIAAHLLGTDSLTPRSRSTFSLPLRFFNNDTHSPLKDFKSNFDFVVDKCCYFMGLKFTPLPNCSAGRRALMQPASITVAEFDYPGNSSGVCWRDALECAFMVPSYGFLLDAGTKYTITFTFPLQYQTSSNYQLFNIDGYGYQTMVRQETGQLKVTYQTQIIGVQISEMIFKMRETANLK